MSEEKRILWAIDPFEKDLNAHWKAAEWLRLYSSRVPCRIEPVHVFLLGSHFASFRGLIEEQEDIKKSGEARATEWLEKTKIGNLAPLRFLTLKYPSVSAGARLLAAYARDSGADFIVVNTHGRTGAKRFLLGSFAEALILSTDHPVVTVNPASKYETSVRHLVFATDLSVECKRCLPAVVELTRSLGAKLVVFHKIFDFTEYYIPWGFAVPGPSPREIASAAKDHVDALVDEARRLGVDAEGVIDRSKKDVDDALVAHAKKLADPMIAIAAKEGRIGIALAGSVTRQVVRTAPCPVWVMHPPSETSGIDARPRKTAESVGGRALLN